MYTRKRISFKVTPGKREDLQEKLVETRETLEKGKETLRRRELFIGNKREKKT